ncbi:predicted protein [Histoplasma capsulatum var. duboisii H88]|uniref:Predicted protein n=1 Tax=Ajellomyces capsulatus (strain H88) TaxID=544711 RepID=F0UL18_AJEC8|nr:predicted protein [Histoplasma capsulatum var. duboisii H88]
MHSIPWEEAREEAWPADDICPVHPHRGELVPPPVEAEMMEANHTWQDEAKTTARGIHRAKCRIPLFPDRRTSIAIADRITTVGMWKGQELSVRAWKSAWKNSGMPWHIAGVEDKWNAQQVFLFDCPENYRVTAIRNQYDQTSRNPKRCAPSTHAPWRDCPVLLFANVVRQLFCLFSVFTIFISLSQVHAPPDLPLSGISDTFHFARNLTVSR